MAQHITPICTLGWNNLWVPKMPKNPKPTDKATCQAGFLFTADDMKLPEFEAIRKDYNQILIDNLGIEKARVMLKEGKIRSIFKTSLESAKYPDTYSCFIDTKSYKPVNVVSKYADPKNPKVPATITDPDSVYMGCRVRGMIFLKWFEMPDKTNRGVTVYINGLQVIENNPDKTPRLDGRVSAAQAFGGFIEAAETVDLTIDEADNMADLLS